ncbi:MAG TPA: hypothetical protein DCW29_02385 [Janthinobacterium sp.]|nr:hypothetical protein [Janthinobacterium sp.]
MGMVKKSVQPEEDYSHTSVQVAPRPRFRESARRASAAHDTRVTRFVFQVNGGANGTVSIKNVSAATVGGPFQIVLDSHTAGVTVSNSAGNFGGRPYMTIPSVGSLAPGQSASVTVMFQNPANGAIGFAPVSYSGSFNES